jgi:hypothetical protein
VGDFAVKGERKREKGKGKRDKGEGRREKGEGRREIVDFHASCDIDG